MVGAAVVLVTVMILRRLMKAGEVKTHSQRLRCGSCGWEGFVSTFKPKCSKCGQPMNA